MKSWKEVPHLFANGKFKAKHKNIDNKTIRGISYNVLYDFNQSKTENCKDCTLIARPISDMSDGEFSKWNNLRHTIVHTSLDETDIERRGSKESFLYLLSIGVYPFDQSHFESGKVIARYENE